MKKSKKIFSEAECKKIFGKISCMIEVNRDYQEFLDSKKKSYILGLTSDELENGFRDFLKNKGLVDKTQDNYVYQMKACYKEFYGVLNCESPFKIQTLDEFKKHYEFLLNYDEYEEWDKSNTHGHGQSSAGFSKYEEFLNEKINKKNNNVNKNIILYGPPGTGKTWTLQHEYIDKFSKENCYMTTFHQSYSYEEFVEGIKAVTTEKGDVNYIVKGGSFYEACVKAASLVLYGEIKDTNLEENKIGKDNALDELISLPKEKREEKISKCIDNSQKILFCIDEINRGNISSIFGELITAIEKDKRLGTENEFIVELPYSRKKFGIPSNLIIVGTMNTADRSIQVMDNALRRRFDFEELLPDYNKISSCQRAQEYLKKINTRIRAIHGKDYQIGHSYFIDCKNDLDIFKVMVNRVIPLLEEYFYNDYSKIRTVLGEDKREENDNTKCFYVEDEEAKKEYEKFENVDNDKQFFKLKDGLSDISSEEKASKYLAL